MISIQLLAASFLLFTGVQILFVTANKQAYHKWVSESIEDVEISEKLNLNADNEQVVLNEDVKEGEILFSIPSNGNLLIPSVIKKHPKLFQLIQKDEVKALLSPTVSLALLIMYERNVVEDSEWSPLLNALPEKSAATIYWPAEDIALLNGTSVHVPTLERIQAVTSLHKALLPYMTDNNDGNDAVFESFELNDFVFAVNHIFGRSIQASITLFHKDDLLGISGENETTIPLIVPFVESLPQTTEPNVGVEIRELDEGEGDSTTGVIVATALKDIKKGETLSRAALGKTNMDLLLNTGQYILNNQDHGITLGIQLSTKTPQSNVKLEILKLLNLTSKMEFFIPVNGEPSVLLLQMLRIEFLQFHNMDSYHRIIRNGEQPVSLSNELQVLRALWLTSSQLLSKFSNSTQEYEIEILESFQDYLKDKNAKPRAMTRTEVAAHLRLSKKNILGALRNWISNRWLSMIDMKLNDLHQLDEFIHFR